ncbi:HlyD family secretion protein [Pseudomonas sp. LP_7_YM]|uniref:HlyD family secretion protein n=1 Tax=Pseudomonas sp. LP_7_YM TaxID=2485137 RepID=UPI00105B7298|nr:HlyD family secretion protein [Pseudomonas sp. LP_7_YM]TDV72611.1 membrane fusion protein (multidrug efflux system) [Pseudomonas sp. LP_7_YM]
MNIAVEKDPVVGPGTASRADLRPSRQRWWMLGGACLAGLGILAWGFYWFVSGQHLQTTDDAYVRADWVAVSARVSGYVAQVEVTDDQPVKAGDVLVRLETRDYQAIYEQAQAVVAEAEGALLAAQARQQVAAERVEQQREAIAQARAAVQSATAEDRRSQLDVQRYRGLVRDNAATQQRLETADAQAQQAHAALQGAQARLREQQALLAVTQAQARLADVQIKARAAAQASALARRTLAQQNRQDTVIRAPVDGVVGQRQVRSGQYVVPGQPMLAVVPVHQTYVVANYKETQLTHMQPGQPAIIHVDSFPDQALRGHVASFSPGSGNVFALLPSDNATGNFTKIVQRFAVRIVLDEPQAIEVLPGMSVTTTVDTRREAGADEQ